jgi:Flp pilus assembly CpaE family ATPase
VVLDLPRWLDDLGTEVVSRCDRVVVVAEPSVAGVASAGRVAGSLRPLNQEVALVVRGAGTAVTAGHVADILDLPLLAEVSHQRRLAEHLDLGLGPVHGRRSPLARAARSVLRSVA